MNAHAVDFLGQDGQQQPVAGRQVCRADERPFLTAIHRIDIDLVDLIKKTQPELASGPKALPASFTAEFQEVRQTTKTYLDVNPAGGIHMVLGFKMVPGTSPTTGPCPPAMSETEEPGNVMLSAYPCGGFVLDPSGA